MNAKLTTFVAALLVLAFILPTSCKTAYNADPQQRARDSIVFLTAEKLIQGKGFMLSGDQLSIDNSPFFNVTSNTNFIIVEGNGATVQISPGIGAGPNGVGGITFRGDISDYKVDTSRKDAVVTFRFNANGGSGDIRIVVYKNSNKATAYVNATFYRGKAQLHGLILPLGGTQIMEGTTRW